MENIPRLQTLLHNLPGLAEANATEWPFLDNVPDQEKAEDILAHSVTALDGELMAQNHSRHAENVL